MPKANTPQIKTQYSRPMKENKLSKSFPINLRSETAGNPPKMLYQFTEKADTHHQGHLYNGPVLQVDFKKWFFISDRKIIFFISPIFLLQQFM